MDEEMRITSQINQNYEEIEELTDALNKYKKLRTKMEEVLPKLNRTKSNINDSLDELSIAYIGYHLPTISEEYNNILTANNNEINKIDCEILPEINSQITAIEKKIRNLNYKISKLREQLRQFNLT